MKNLFIINQFASTPENLFGAGERFYYLSSYFAREGFKVKVISGGYNHLFKKYPNTEKMFTSQYFADVEFVWVKLKQYKHTSFLGRLISWFEFLIKLFFLKIKDKPDIVIVSSMSLLPIIYALLLRFKYKAKFILEIRDIWPLTPVEIGGYSKINPLIFFLRKIELLGYKKADSIISVLPGFKKYLDENGFAYKPFTWIPNGVVAVDGLQQRDSPIRFDLSKFNVVYTGAIGKANALDDLISAALLLNDYPAIQINIVGEGPEKLRLENSSRSLKNVVFYNSVAKTEVGMILKEADVCYIGWHNIDLYKYGVSANKYNDYMFAKKPILSASNIIDDPVVLSNSGIQVQANNSEAIAQGIISFYKMTLQERLIMGKNGYDFVLSNQTYPILAEKYIMILNDLV